MSIQEKKYQIKVYNINGQYLETWGDATFDGFKQSINGGLGECVIHLARKFDNFGEGTDVELSNEVRIWINDGDTGPAGRLVYSGFISRYEPFIDGPSEGITIYCIGYVSRLSRYPIEGEATPEHTETGDISTIITNLIGNYRSGYLYHPSFNTGGAFIRINTSSDSIPHNTGNTLTYTFSDISVYDAIERMRLYAPANWWWYIGPDNLLQFKSKPKGATHRFVFGKDFKSVKIQKNNERMINNVHFWNGLMKSDDEYQYQKYTDRTSEEKYYAWWRQITDGRITTQASADLLGNATLSEFKDPEIRTEIEILDNNGAENGYDIESIQVGDTCSLRGFNDQTQSTFEDNMTIAEVNYTLDSVRLVLWNKQVESGRQIYSLQAKLDDTINSDAGN